MLRTWVKDKLSIIPAMYSKYDEGMKAIKDLIQQDFAPQYHSIAMQAFYKEFYIIGVGSTETGSELWSRWRHTDEKNVTEFMGLHAPASYNIVESGGDTSPGTSYDRRTALDIPTGTSRSADATMERQLRTSALISEAEAKLLRNRDSNYWGDLATPVWPQSPGKAKVVYIRPKSSRNNSSPEDQNYEINSGFMESDLSKNGSKSYRRNSLPPLGTSITNSTSNTGGISQDIPASGELHTSLEEICQEIGSAVFRPIEKTPPTPVPPLRLRKHCSDGSHPIPMASQAIIEESRQQSGRHSPRYNTFASGTGFFRKGFRTRSDTPDDRAPGIYHSRSEGLFLGTSISTPTNNSRGKGNRLQRTNLKIQNFLGSESYVPSLREDMKSATRADDNEPEICWPGRSLSIQEVHQGHGILGLHSPVKSFVASPNKSPTTREGLHPLTIPRSPERLIPVFPLTRIPTSSSVYSSDSNESHNITKAEKDIQVKKSLKIPHQVLSKDSPGKIYNNNGEGYQFYGTSSIVPSFPKTTSIPHAENFLWQSKQFPPLGQRTRSSHIQTNNKNSPVTRSNSGEHSRKVTFDREVNRALNHPGATQKLRSRFSFVLPQIHLGSRPAHINRRRNSMQPSVLRVTKEVTQEEENDFGGKFNRSTFTAHVPRFGKDPMKEIHKAHARGDIKKPAFLRVIQDAVQDGISITKKNPPRANKMIISGPIHDGNPLQLSSSTSTPRILLTALPITSATHSGSSTSQSGKELSNTMAPNQHRSKVPGAVLLPWEMNDASMGEDEFLSDGNESIAQHMSKKNRLSPGVAASPAITIGPFQQAALYSWIECSVVQACSDFLKQQQTSLNLDLLKKEVKKWRNEEIKFATGEVKKRDRPVEFMFGMEVQCKLVEGSHKALIFSGPSAMNPIAIIVAWKHIIPSFSPRTFCFPDYLVLEHLRVIEKVLHLFGPAYWDNKIYEKKRAEIVACIIDSGQVRKTRSAEEKMEKLQKEREKAEAQLLMEVGIWQTEESVVNK